MITVTVHINSDAVLRLEAVNDGTGSSGMGHYDVYIADCMMGVTLTRRCRLENFDRSLGAAELALQLLELYKEVKSKPVNPSEEH